MSDIALYTPDVDGLGIQAMVSNASGGREVAGPELLAQRFMIKLLKTKESSPYFPDGCSFVNNVNANIFTELDVFTAFSAALSEVDPLMRAEETDDMPDDERFTGAAIIELELVDGAATLSIAVFNRAGTSIAIRLPMEVS